MDCIFFGSLGKSRIVSNLVTFNAGSVTRPGFARIGSVPSNRGRGRVFHADGKVLRGQRPRGRTLGKLLHGNGPDLLVEFGIPCSVTA
jgi:hypothetical protein